MSAPQPGRDDLVRTRFTSDDAAEVTDFIRQMYAENRSHFSRITRGARFSAFTHDVPTIGADRVRTSIDYEGTSDDGFEDYVFFLVHDGSVQIDSARGGTVAGRGDVSVYPLGTPISFTMHGFDVTTLRLPAELLARAAHDATGVETADFTLDAITPISAPMHRYWRSLLSLTASTLMAPATPLTSTVLADDLARTLAQAALHTFPNTTMTQHHLPGPGGTAPATIRRAVAHLEANAHRPVQLADVAAAAGTSARALQHGFRQHLGTTPLAHLRRIRLERAHRELQDADPTRGATVADIAARWGFANPGRFAQTYRATYGHPPSRTLRA